MAGTAPSVPGNAPIPAAAPTHADHRAFAASSVAAAFGCFASVGRNNASTASANDAADSAAASTHGGPSHQSPHAPVRVSESNTAGTPAAVSGFAAPHSCTREYEGFTEPAGRPAADSKAAVIAAVTSAATLAGMFSCGHLLSRANWGVLCTTQHSPSSSPATPPPPCRRLAVTLEAHDTTSEPTTCAPSIPLGTSRGWSTTNISAHTEERMSLRCLSRSTRGRMPNAHWSERVSFSAAPDPSGRLAVPARRAAHFPLCATATKSKVPRRLPLGPEASSQRRFEPSPPMGVIAPTHWGRTMSTSSPVASASARGRRPPTPT